MASEASAAVPRHEGFKLCIPVVYGTIASWMGKQPEGNSLHEWVVYLRGPRGEDLSYCIQKVEFQLHPSFENPNRAVEAFPFQLEERGWGEFDIIMRIYVRDPHQGPIEAVHRLKLYNHEEVAPQPSRKPVVSESYDEIVIESPTVAFYDLVVGAPPPPCPPTKYTPFYREFDEASHLRSIMAAQNFVTGEIDRLYKELEELEGPTSAEDPEFCPPMERHPSRV